MNIIKEEGKENKMDRDVLVVIMAACLIISISLIGLNQYFLNKAIEEFYDNEKQINQRVFDNYVIRGLAGSGSMKPIINKDVSPDIEVVNRNLSDSEPLYLGRVYTYKGKNDTLIIHRLVGIYNISETIYYVFLGDNNIIADDPVMREDIIEELVSINYDGVNN